MKLIFDVLGLTIMLFGTIAYHGASLVNLYRPVSADARRLRAHLRNEAPLKGRVDRFPPGAGLTDDMRREIGAVEGFRYVSTRRHPHFGYIGRPTGKLPDA